MAGSGGATRVKAFEVYRYDPESGENPRLDIFEVDLDDCGPMVLDALIWIKNKIDSTLAFRRSCREGVCGSCAMNMYGTNWLACTRHITDLGDPGRIYPLASRTIIKDLDAQYHMIEPWLKTKTAAPDAERSSGKRSELDGYYECILCFCCTSACPGHWWNPGRFLGPAALLQAWRWITDSRDEGINLEDPFRLSLSHHSELHPNLSKGLLHTRYCRNCGVNSCAWPLTTPLARKRIAVNSA